ncbi:MAG: FIST N-terminal domain-containing protein [Pseudomonadota bacterium]|nr:FIST N-terminal domain-containing protein [Pseudomonadota bacterium]
MSTSPPFATAFSRAADWRASAQDLADQLVGTVGGLGLLYTGVQFAGDLDAMVTQLKQQTGVGEWVAATGYGVISSEMECFGEVGATAMIVDLAPAGYRLFSGGATAGADLKAAHGPWLAEAVMPLVLVHADPRREDAMDAVEQLASDCGGFLVGGLTVGEGTPHRADLGGASLSGAAFSPAVVEMATGLSQGCTPLTEPRIATEVQQNILIEIDGRPALDVLMEDIGPELASDLSQCAGVIFAARPVPGSDTADYTVRNLVGIDPEQKLVAIGDLLEDGDPIMFCRRDSESAVVDMRRMAGDLKRRIGDKPVRGGIYISCAARGPNQFAAPEREIDIIRDTLGSFPLTGFFANGEISRDRVYAYTGVLTLFL